jgi:nitroimidazol reductase NimA-like FMN-containing flavoprotein (pyridoxamine 5'-phosphate oxidase superfamily)
MIGARDAETARMKIDDNGLEILDRDECFELLASQPIARLGLSMKAMPVVLPVNFLLDGDQIVLRTAEGSKLQAALSHSVVAVEVDDYDPVSHTGWSVLVRGTSWVVEDPGEVARLSQLWIRPWANEQADQWVAVAIDMISGRRIRPDYQLHATHHQRHSLRG